MSEQASLAELLSTIERMEARLSRHPLADVQTLMAAYRDLAPRFEADLSASERDIALAKASALMLVQQIALRS